ncbi:hypothetical protein FIBSPDRAFT_946011 [Athelia psychrophila]|uniref:Uncharacterized protein n=1 Tax=Athelia psychrophila TaxID=1759441 RepID=A0A166T7E0_9AGAM|nr:hypothetical protein FIBSPDRAFT_946011 [Fibularhizoctonia sp. CBS 109695]
MYERLGTQWAACVIAFLAVLCVPIPFIFYKSDSRIRGWSKHAPPDLHDLQKRRKADLEADLEADAKRKPLAQDITEASKGEDDGTTKDGKSG